MRIQAANLSCQAEAIHLRHLHIQDENVEMLSLADPAQCLLG